VHGLDRDRNRRGDKRHRAVPKGRYARAIPIPSPGSRPSVDPNQRTRTPPITTAAGRVSTAGSSRGSAAKVTIAGGASAASAPRKRTAVEVDARSASVGSRPHSTSSAISRGIEPTTSLPVRIGTPKRAAMGSSSRKCSRRSATRRRRSSGAPSVVDSTAQRVGVQAVPRWAISAMECLHTSC
jgi:hypothetical protein